MIKNVLFDLDDTLFDFKMSERIALSKTLRELGTEPTDYMISQYSKYNISMWKRLELGEISRDEVKVNRYRLLFDEFGLDYSPETATSIYEKKLAIGHYFIDGAEELLQRLFGKYNLYLVSNGAKRVQDGRIESAGIAKYFKGIFISEVVGVEKPSPDFFAYCFERIEDFDKKETVIIGDSLSSDIKGGINSGIKTIWFNAKKQINDTDIIPDYETDSLDKIESLLGNI